MSVIQSIRDRGAWIMLILIALALIAFILQDGLGRGRGSSIFSNTTNVGSVNGIKITKEDFDAKLTLYSRGQSKDAIIPQLWNQEVQTILQQQEYDKLGLVVSSKELADFFYSPQSPLMREKEFQDDKGQLDPSKVQQWFSELKKPKNAENTKRIIEQVIDPATQQLLSSKYQNLIQQSAYVPTWLIEKQKADNAAISSISYVYVPYSSIVDSTIKVSDDEIMAYVRKHPKNFEKEEETRSFSYVSFDASASAADSANVYNQLLTEKNEFAASTDVKQFFAKANSEMPYYDGYIGKKQIQQSIKDTLFKLAPGQTFGPYVDGKNYVVAKMVGIKQFPDTAKVRHILVSTHQRDQSGGGLMRVREDSSAKKIIDSVADFIAKGAKWDSICNKYSEDQGSKEKGGVYDNFVTGGMVPEFNDFSFEGKIGERKIVKTDFGYHLIEILSQKGSQPAYKIAYLAKPIIISNETVGAASTAALQFASQAKNKSQFDEAAKKINKTVLSSQEIKEGEFSIPVFGQEPSRSIIRWLYENDLGTVSEPTEVGEKYIVSVITSISPKGLLSVNEARPRVEGFVKKEKKAKQIIESKFKGNTLESFAASAGVGVQKADSLSFANPSAPAFGGYDLKLLGASFNKEMQGKVTEPIAGSEGVMALKVESIGAKPTVQDNESIKQNLLQSARNAAQRGSGALRKAATIKDYRMKFY